MKCIRGDTSYNVGMTRIVRLVSLVPPLISIWGASPSWRQAVSRAITRSLLTLRSELCLRSCTFSKKVLHLKRNSLKTKSKSFPSNSFKNKPLSRTTVCEGNSTVENGLPTASCLKTNGNKFLSFTHRRLRGVYFFRSNLYISIITNQCSSKNY